MYETKLKFSPYAQARICHYDNGEIELISYYTSVIFIDKNGWLSCTGTYSQTTRKHISHFMREISKYFGVNLDYYTAKKMLAR